MSLTTKTNIRDYIRRWFSDNTTDEGALVKLLEDISESSSILEEPLVVTGNTTLTSDHLGRNILVQAAATITVPETATEDLPNGFYCNIKRDTSGVVDFATEGTDALDVIGGATAIANESGWITVHKESDGVYSLIGDV